MYYPEEVIEDVRIRNDIVEVASSYIKLERKGRRYFALCPFHGEKTASFCIEPTKQFFYCFGCNKGGSVIHFIMDIENLEFVDALKFLADRAGITLPEPNDNREKEKTRIRKKILEANKEAARFFFSNLASSSGVEAQGYLKKRNLTEKAIKQFGIGFALQEKDALTNYLLNKGMSKGLLLDAGLSTETKDGYLIDRFRGRIMFPIFDIRGNTIGFGGRALGDIQPKYLNSPDTLAFNKRRELYGLNYARLSKSKKLLIVEGYLDVISLHQGGIDYAVASLGTALTQSQAWLLKKYADEVIFCYDSDTAGQAATLRGLEILEKSGCNVRVLLLPDGKDPDEYIKNNGSEKFKNLVERAISLLEYKIKVQQRKHNVDNIDDKIKLLNSIAEVLAEHDNEVEIELYTEAYAEQYGISRDSLEKEINKVRNNQKQNSGKYLQNRSNYSMGNRQPSITSVDPRYGELEYILLLTLCNENRLYQTVSQSYGLDDFKDSGAKLVARKVYERISENKSCVLGELLNELDSQQAAYMVRLSETKCKLDDCEKAVEQIINKLLLYTLEEEQKLTFERIKNEQDGDIRKELAVEFSERAEKIAELKRFA